MKVYIVGNPLVKQDSLPFTLLPTLMDAFPDVMIEEADPNENFVPEEGSVIVDTVEGIQDVQLFEDIDTFVTTKSVSPHDYDLGFHLQLLKKLHKLVRVTIIGVPAHDESGSTGKQVIAAIRQIVSDVR